MMKAGFFDPYLDTIGGGERYVLTLAEYLSQKNWQVDLFWNEPQLKEKLILRLNLNLDRINFKPVPQNIFAKWKASQSYDLFFWLSDGSVSSLFAKKNILHFQVPFHDVGGRSFLNQLKLKKIDHIVCNSNFTKGFIDQEFQVSSKVIYPPVDVKNFKPGKKENIILSVGRFSQLLQAKRQDVLIQVFKKMIDQGLSGWRLVLVGATDVGGKDYFNQLKRQAEGCPIEFWENPEFKTLQTLYGKAKIFWSASGFGVNEKEKPEKVEHFGITIVEAMATGCIPMAVGKGGPKEILEDGKTGFLWQSEEGLVEQTLRLAKDPAVIKRLAQKVIKSSQRFDKIIFCRKFDEIIS